VASLSNIVPHFTARISRTIRDFALEALKSNLVDLALLIAYQPHPAITLASKGRKMTLALYSFILEAIFVITQK
jgi:hypothetical protein